MHEKEEDSCHTKMAWVKGQLVGRGSFATVHLAATTNGSILAVKSAPLSQSHSLQTEEQILSHLHSCPRVVSCYGHDIGKDAAGAVYNLFLEYVPGGSLDHLRRRSGGRVPEQQVRRLVRSALSGLCFMHANGYVHCDVKPHNLLLFSPSEVKIADFGLAKRAGVAPGQMRGTPLYMAPEAVAHGECEAPADVWGLGCTVVELVTGVPAWKCGDVAGVIYRIGSGGDLPEIPLGMSEQGRDFLSKCFVREPSERWTSEMLLRHPFVAGAGDSVEVMEEESPRSHLEFAQWSSIATSISYTKPLMASVNIGVDQSPLHERIRKIATKQMPSSWFDASSSEDWITVIDHHYQCSTLERNQWQESVVGGMSWVVESGVQDMWSGFRGEF